MQEKWIFRNILSIQYSSNIHYFGPKTEYLSKTFVHFVHFPPQISAYCPIVHIALLDTTYVVHYDGCFVHSALINLHNRAIFCAIYHWTLGANGGIMYTVNRGTLKISDGRAPVPNFGIGKIPISATIVDYQLLTSYRLKPYKKSPLETRGKSTYFQKTAFQRFGSFRAETTTYNCAISTGGFYHG